MIYIFLFAVIFFTVIVLFYFTPFCQNIRRLKTREKIVALTFDDGPNPPFTDQIVSILNHHHVKATFFLTGQNIQKHPQVVARIQAGGHGVGNHSFSHSRLIFKSSIFIQHEIEWTDGLLKQAGAREKIYFRSPHGMQFVKLGKMLKSLKRKNILFDVLAWDWLLQSPKWIAFLATTFARPGSIIVLHDGGGERSATVAALPLIISKLENNGFRFVDLDELV